MKKIFLLFLFFFILSSFFSFVFAQEPPRPLEVTYPQITPAPIEVPTTIETPIPAYVKYIYYIVVGICGLVALGALIYGGIRYLASAGRPEALKDAKDQIFAALFGILILLGSWLILYNINPEIVRLRLPTLRPIIPPQFSGILLCKKTVPILQYYDERQKAEELSKRFETEKNEETKKTLKTEIERIKEKLDVFYKEIRQECYLVGGKGNLPDEWDNKIEEGTGQIYIIPTKYLIKEDGTTKEILRGYGILLFEDRNYKDDIQWVSSGLPNSPHPYSPAPVKIKDISSVIPYVVIQGGDLKERDVTIYEEVNWNEGAEDKQTQVLTCSDYYCGFTLNFSPRSLEIQAENKTIVVLSEEEKTTGLIYNGHVFIKDEPNLLKYSRIRTRSPLKCLPVEITRGGCPTAKYAGIAYGEIY